MIGQKNVTIGGVDYMLTQFKATQGLVIEMKLIKLLGPAFVELQKMAADGGGEDEVLTLAINKLIEQMDKIDVVSLIKELVMSATRGTVAFNFDQEFAGRYGDMFELVKEVLVFNFADVFSKLGLNSGQMNLA